MSMLQPGLDIILWTLATTGYILATVACWRRYLDAPTLTRQLLWIVATALLTSIVLSRLVTALSGS